MKNPDRPQLTPPLGGSLQEEPAPTQGPGKPPSKPNAIPDEPIAEAIDEPATIAV